MFDCNNFWYSYYLDYRSSKGSFNSHFTYFVQLPYPRNLLNLKIRRFIRKQLFVILINKVQQDLFARKWAFNASLC